MWFGGLLRLAFHHSSHAVRLETSFANWMEVYLLHLPFFGAGCLTIVVPLAPSGLPLPSAWLCISSTKFLANSFATPRLNSATQASRIASRSHSRLSPFGRLRFWQSCVSFLSLVKIHCFAEWASRLDLSSDSVLRLKVGLVLANSILLVTMRLG